MKVKLYYIIVLGMLMSSCISDKLDNQSSITSDIISPENPPKMEFEIEVFNFDTVAVGESVNHTFKFKNLGPGPLLIHSVKAACGCTVLKEWPDYPIEVGETGEIPIEFSSNHPGPKSRYISILANTKPASTKLYLEGYVSGI